MDKKKLTTLIGTAAITVLAAILFIQTAVNSFWMSPTTDEIKLPPANTSKQTTTSDQDYPLKLIIPAINIDTNIQYVGITKDGNMAVPRSYRDVGWYKYGKAPGQNGTAVIAGHVDSGLGFGGIFATLKNINIGDDVFVSTKGGSKVHFKVVDKQTYPYLEVPADKLFNMNDGTRLNLITCVGAWTADHTTYDHRLIIFTKKVDQ